MSAQRWLLMLGSNLDDDARVRAALAALAALGPVTALGPIRRLPPREGAGPAYYNVLAVLDCTLDEAGLRRALQALERELGRRRDVDEVAIDIDLLARHAGRTWRSSRHAEGKGEIARWPATQLLEEAGIRLAPA